MDQFQLLHSPSQEAKDVTAFLRERLKKAMDTRDLVALSAKDAHTGGSKTWVPGWVPR